MSFSEADRMELDSTYSSSRKWDFLPGSFREGRRFDWEVNGDLQVRDDLEKNLVARAAYI